MHEIAILRLNITYAMNVTSFLISRDRWSETDRVVYKVPYLPPPGEVYQLLSGRISSCEEGKEIQGLFGRISRGKKGKGK